MLLLLRVLHASCTGAGGNQNVAQAIPIRHACALNQNHWLGLLLLQGKVTRH
jgi:hypothetical protein